jgi:hypothetical protein
MPDELVPRLEAYIRARDPQGSVRLENDHYVTTFSALGAPQELRIRSGRASSWAFAYAVTLPGAKERWFLESKRAWFPERSGCRRVQVAPLDARFKMYASDAPSFAAVFSGPPLADALLQLPAEHHLKASLKEGALRLAWKVRGQARTADREGHLLDCADLMVRLGVQCFKSVQVARLARGEASTLSK